MSDVDADLLRHLVRPFFVEFHALVHALEPLHLNFQSDIDALHDVWKLGAPSPRSAVYDAKAYDERGIQKGNLVERLIFPKQLAVWMVDVSQRRGMPLTYMQALNLINGREDYGRGYIHGRRRK